MEIARDCQRLPDSTPGCDLWNPVELSDEDASSRPSASTSFSKQARVARHRREIESHKPPGVSSFLTSVCRQAAEAKLAKARRAKRQKRNQHTVDYRSEWGPVSSRVGVEWHDPPRYWKPMPSCGFFEQNWLEALPLAEQKLQVCQAMAG